MNALVSTAFVVHCKRAEYDVYIGRPSKWGNPFRVGVDGTREEVIEKYRQYLTERPRLVELAKKELRAKVLGCWCPPKSCHGEILAAIANEPEAPSVHLCHARGCKIPVKPERLFCRPHWKLVPKHIQKRVWANYREGQCADKQPSEDWLEAADAAIQAVFEIESAPVVEAPLVPKPAGAACAQCPLRSMACVPTERAAHPKLAIVGEAPGRNEVEQGIPFIGQSGKKLDRILSRLGIRREDVLWTNAALCGVPRDKDVGAAARACRDRLQADLVGVPIVVPVGAHAVHSVLRLPRKPKIMDWRGFVVREENRIVLPTVHPAFVLRSPLWEPVIQNDFERVARILKNGWVAPENLNNRISISIKTVEALRRELRGFGHFVSVDVETTEEPAWKNRLLCLSITDVQTEKTVVIPWVRELDGTGGYFGPRQQEVADFLSDFLVQRRSVTHNGPAFDHIVLNRHGIEVGEWDDTLIAHHAFASHMPQNLGHVTTMYVDAPAWKQEQKQRQQRGELRVTKDLHRYNGRDTLYTALDWKGMQEDLRPEKKIYEADRAVAELGRDMQVSGMRFDKAQAARLSTELLRVMKESEAVAQRAVGFALPLRGKGSHKELNRAIFEVLGAPVFFRSELTGKAALNVDALRAYSCYADPRLRDLAGSVLEFRKAQKALTTYIEPIETDAADRVHPSWHCYGTVSGRFACRQPNLMNLHRPANDPAKALGGIRSLYVSAPGHVIVAFDASQLEMRIAAYASGDEVMIQACETSDLHAANAELLFGDAFRTAAPAERKMYRDIAKQSGFAVAYMAGAPTVHTRIIAAGLPMTLQQVEAMLKKMRQTFKAYYAWQDEQFHKTIRLGYVETPILKRKRWLGYAPELSANANFPVQGGAADHMNLLLPKLVSRLPPEAPLIAQIHDAAMFDVPERLVDDVKNIIRQTALEKIEVGGRLVLLPIEIKTGNRWSDAA